MSNQYNSLSSNQTFLPEIRRARFERLTIFEISESELEVLEKGSPDSIYLNVAIALLSSAISLTAVLFTATIANTAIFIIFVICTVVGYVIGIILLLLWRRSRSSVLECIKVIRKRLPPEGTAQTLNSDINT